MQKHVNLVDLVKSFPTNIFLQNLASIQKRTNPIKFAHLAEKSEKGSISNLSTKVRADAVMRSDADLLSGKIDQAMPLGLVVQQILERREVLTRVVGVNVGRVKVRSRTFDQGS